MECSMLGFTVLHYLSEVAHIHIHWFGVAIQATHPLSLPFLLLLIFLSIKVFFNESSLCIRWPRVLELQLQHQSFQWIYKVNLLRIDQFDPAVQGTLKSLLQHRSSKAWIFWHSAFFMVQLSHPYLTTRKIIALTRWNFVSKVMFLLFNMVSRLVIAFLPRIKCLLISWLQSPSAVILGPKKIKSVTVFLSFPIYLPWSDETGCHHLSFLNAECEASFFTLFFHFHQEALHFLP